MIQTTAKIDEKGMRKFRKLFGESSNQALIRYGVAVARGCAVLTEPRGRSKKQIIKNIITGAKTNISDVPARTFNQIVKRRNPSFMFKGGVAHLSPSQILESPDDVNDFIEDHRGKDGRVRRLPPSKRALTKTPVMNKTLVRRKKLAGITKGSWLGAGMALAKKSRGPSPARIGKNFMKWAQKHSDKGRAKYVKRTLGKSEVHLISDAPATLDTNIFSKRTAKEATRNGWKQTVQWYRRAVKASVS